MKLLKIVIFAASLIVAGVAIAGEPHQMKFKIAIAEDDGNGEVVVNLDSDDLGFDLQDLQEGETRSIVDESGRSILITREAKGYKIDVDGKTIEMPLFESEHGSMWVSDGYNEDVEIHMMGDAKFVSIGDFSGVNIISSEPIDEITQEGIKALLASSGHSGDVNFIDTSDGPHGLHEVRIITKEVVSEN